MASSTEELEKNIQELNDTIAGLNKPVIDLGSLIKNHLMPTRKCCKLLLMKQCNGMDEVAAHTIVYGHPRVNDETVDYKYAMKESSEMYRKIEQMKTDLINSASSLANESGRAVIEEANLIAAAASSVSASADQLKTIPPQPVAAAHTLLSLNQLVTQVGTSFAKLTPILGPLAFIPLVVAEGSIDAVVSPINSTIKTLNTSLKAISAIKVG